MPTAKTTMLPATTSQNALHPARLDDDGLMGLRHRARYARPMPAPAIINPDDYLETPDGRVWTPERNDEAWRLSYAALERAIELSPEAMRVVVVCGVQGAGKSTWIASQPASSSTIYFDAALPGARHRAAVVGIAKRLGASAEAVWIDTPLDVALARNAARTPDKVVPSSSIIAVANQFEEPSVAEGFDGVSRYSGS